MINDPGKGNFACPLCVDRWHTTRRHTHNKYDSNFFREYFFTL